MIYVLIILWFPAGSQSGKAVHTQEFTTAARCQTAANELTRQAHLIRAWCTQK